VSRRGTESYGEVDTEAIPPLVMSAVQNARAQDFPHCVRPEIGGLLAVLAGGLTPGALVGETGTGTGAGLAWMVSAAPDGVRFVSYERDEQRAASAQALFADHEHVEVVCGDSLGLFDHGPFDLLIHDGGPAAGKRPGDEPIDPTVVLRPGGTMTVDDYGPQTSWPPRFEGNIDAGRLAWFEHPAVRTTEINVAPDMAVVLSRYLPPE